MSLIKELNKKGDKCKVTFLLPVSVSPENTSVIILGDFNEWNKEKAEKLSNNGENFEVAIEIPTGKNYQFKYLVGDAQWENDWSADGYVCTPDGIENSLLILDDATAKTTTTQSTASATKEVIENTKKATPSSKSKSKSTDLSSTKPSDKKASVKKSITAIKGITPKFVTVLKEEGISTFDDLAKLSVSQLLDMALKSKIKVTNGDNIIKSAQMAVAGNWDDFAGLN